MRYNDGEATLANGKVINEAISHLEKAGKEVLIAIPKEARSNFNDVMQKGGKAAVAKALAHTLSGSEFKDQIKRFETEKGLAKTLNHAAKQNRTLDQNRRRLLEQQLSTKNKSSNELVRQVKELEF